MAEPPTRWTVRACGAGAAASALVFGGDGPLLRTPAGRAGADASTSAACGPEVACVQTAEALGWSATVLPQMRGPDLGSWAGRPLSEVAAADPAGLAAWARDPDARPHDGETLTEVVGRLSALLEAHRWPEGPSGWVGTPLVVRALAVAALAAPPALVLALDVSFGGELQLSGRPGRWRLQGLSRVAPAGGGPGRGQSAFGTVTR